MPRPKTKGELLAQATERYQALMEVVETLPTEELLAPGTIGEWSIKDVLAHIWTWQQMMFAWYEAGTEGYVPKTPSEDYTWRQTPELNQVIYEENKHRPLGEVLLLLASSHEKMVLLIETLSERELFDKGVYAWTKSAMLGSYFTSATSSHYEWARKEAQKGLKQRVMG